MSLAIGDRAPDLSLPDTEGTEQALARRTAQPSVVVFTCNHCPYALAWHDRILERGRRLRAAGRALRWP